MFQEMFPILSTPDLPRALRFYRDLLGCTVTYQFPPEGSSTRQARPSVGSVGASG
jgi:catechol 2,3-dioxygenase-like lactoylglutathione lyase family enzyme